MKELKTDLTSNNVNCVNNVFRLSEIENYRDKEEIYLKVREKEGRLLSDEVVKALPHVSPNHPFYEEWKTRADSLKKVKRYITNFKRPLTVLDVGCGNGWMSNKISEIPNCHVYGIDLNTTELEQGAKVFSGNNQLTFFYGNIFDDILLSKSFDLIILASSIQYFPNLEELFNRLFPLLNDRGEVHILDSPLYDRQAVPQARKRTQIHYDDLGVPGMATYYHHHLMAELDAFHPVILYNPNTLYYRLRKKLFRGPHSPFYWLKLVKK